MDEKYEKILNKITTYTIDENYEKQLKSLVSQIQERNGMVKDPNLANINYFNRRGTALAHGVEPEHVGKTYIFMTRPNLNLSSVYNLQAVNFFRYCLSFELGRRMLIMLQHSRVQNLPLSHFGMKDNMKKYKINSCFIPMVSNYATSSSGGKDLNMETYETGGDYQGNKMTFAKGADQTFSIGEITIDYEDVKYSPVFLFHYIWFLYIHHVCKGNVIPRIEHIIDKIIDYTSSIYIFVTDESHSRIIHWMRYMGCFPKMVPFGQVQHKKDVDPMSFSQLGISYVYNRLEVDDVKTINDFNIISKEFVFNSELEFSGEDFGAGTGELKPPNDMNKITSRYSDIIYGGQIRKSEKRNLTPLGFNDEKGAALNNYGVPLHFIANDNLNDLYIKNRNLPEKFLEDPLENKEDKQFPEMEELNKKLDEIDRFNYPLDKYFNDKMNEKSDKKIPYSNIYKTHPFIYNNHIVFV